MRKRGGRKKGRIHKRIIFQNNLFIEKYNNIMFIIIDCHLYTMFHVGAIYYTRSYLLY